MKEVKAPHPYRLTKTALFLAGSIEQGKAEHWQRRVAATLAEEDILILNPRRESWEDLGDEGEHSVRFRTQVTWELNALQRADIILFNFLPETFSPISLLELGLYKDHPRVVVCCPHSYWRHGNIEIVCKRFKISLFAELDEALTRVRRYIQECS
jgi:hypothetical protein